jgi:ketosteroid isomerase-like protein
MRFVERFALAWRDPQPETFAELFTEDGTLFHPTMEHEIPRAEVPNYVQRLKSLAPDVKLQVKDWAACGAVVLIEWVISATFAGAHVELKGADRFTLRADRAVEGVAYYDTSALWNMIDPETPHDHLLDAAEKLQASLPRS